MSLRKRFLWLILCFLLASSHDALAVRNEELPSVTVLADNSLTLPLTLIAREFARERDVMISVAFASAIEQLEDIEDGNPANVLITAQPGSIDQLKAQGLADVYSQSIVARNELVLVTRKEHPVQFQFAEGTSLNDALEPLGKYYYFVAADPTFLELGIFSSEIIDHYGWDKELGTHFVFPNDLPSMHELIAERPHAGLLYMSEAKRNHDLRIIDTVPQETYSPVQYEAIVVAGEYMNTARNFIEYLNSPAAQKVFADMGFEVAQ